MKILRRLAYAILGIIALLVVITFFLPKHAHVERSITINAPASSVFGAVNDLEKWKDWSPWLNMDPDMKLEYGQTTVGQGASYTWDSKMQNVGTGKMTIAESVPNSIIKTTMNFAPNMDDEMYAQLKFTEVEGQTTILWDFDGDFKGSGKWFGIMMDKILGPQYEKGLASLKEYVEKK